jgi:glutaredoxin-related protein
MPCTLTHPKCLAERSKRGALWLTWRFVPSIALRGVQEFSQWPTYPQVYVNGELLGGCDIVLEMAQSGELAEELAKAGAASGGKDALRQRLEALVKQQPVMLFMKVRRAGPGGEDARLDRHPRQRAWLPASCAPAPLLPLRPAPEAAPIPA